MQSLTPGEIRALWARAEDRIHHEPNTGCWLYGGSISGRGYGMLSHRAKNLSVHRLAYERFKGPIPTGLVVDHLCRTPLCVNPDHLEVVTQFENVMRGRAFVARYAKVTHCAAGHAYDAGRCGGTVAHAGVSVKEGGTSVAC